MPLNLFPHLPGLTWDLKAVPTWSTVLQTARNRRDTALMNDPFPLWTFELNFEFLRSSRNTGPSSPANPNNYTELDLIAGFYNRQGGRLLPFLLDPALLTGCGTDGRATCQIGTGDGATTVFQLVRNQGGFLDEVQAPVGTVTVTVNGVPSTTWTLGPAGQVTFAAAPAVGAVVAAGFQWRWRVRFAEDSLGLQGFMFQLYELQSLKLTQAKL